MADQSSVVKLIINVVSQGEKTLKAVSKSLQTFEKDLKDSTKETKKAGTASKKTAKDVGTLDKSVEKLDKSTKKSSKSLKKYNKEAALLGKSSKKGISSVNQLNTAGSGLVTTFTSLVATMATFGFPIVKASQFQRSMSEVQAISGATGDELVLLTDRAREMGSTTEYTATQAADGLRYLSMAGLSVTESLEALPGVLNLAQAGAMDLGRAADITTNILSGFGLPVSELARVNDVLVQTFTNTNSTLEELGYAMSYVAPIAAGLGAEFEEVTAALGLLHNAGMKGSLAGTTLRGIMARLVSPTRKASEILDKLGKRLGDTDIKLRNAQGNWIGFSKLLKQFEDSGLTAAEAMELLGQRAGPGLAALLSAGSEAMEKMAQLNRDAEGRAKTIAKVMHENVVGSFKAWGSILEDTAIELGNHLLPIIDSFIKKATKVTTAVRDWAQENPKLAKGLLSTGLAIASVVTGALVLSGIITGIIAVSGPLIATLSSLVSGLAAIGSAAAASIAGIAGLTTTMAALTGGLVTLGAAIVTFLGLFTFSDTFRGWILEMELFGLSVREWWETLKAHITLAYVELDTLLGGALTGTFNILRGVLNYIKPLAKDAFSTIMVWVEKAKWVLVSTANYVGGGFLNGFKNAFKAVLWVVKNTVRGVQLALGVMITQVTGKLLGLISLLKSIPGVSKLIDVSGMDQAVEALERVHSAGEALQDLAKEGTNYSKSQLEALRTSAQQTLDDLRAEAQARKDYQALKAREIELQTNIDNAIKKVIATRAVEESKLKASLDTAKAALKEQSQLYVNLAEAADDSLSNLSKSIKERTQHVWDAATDDSVVNRFRTVLDGINEEFATSGEERKKRLRLVEAEMAQARIDSAMTGLDDINKLYDLELDSFRKLEEAKHIVDGQLDQQRLEAEARVSKDIDAYSQDIYKNKVTYAKKAQEELNNILNDSLKKEEAITNAIIALQDKVHDSRKTAEEKIRDLRRSGMTDYQRYVEEVSDVERLLQEASATMSTDAEKSIELYNKAIGLASGLGKEVENGGRVVVNQSAAITKAINLIERAEQGVVRAGKTGQGILKSNLQEQQETTSTASEAISGLQKQIDILTEKMSAAIKLDVEVDTEQFNKSLKALEEQAVVKMTAAINFNEASSQLAQWQLETADQVQAIKIPLELAKTEEILATIGENSRLAELLKEEVQLNIEKGESVDVATQSLLQITGMASELAEGVKISVDDGGTINVAQQEILDLASELDNLPDEKVVKVKVEVDTGEAVLGQGQAPVIAARAKGGLAGFNRLGSRHITSGGGLKDDVPAMLKKDEYVHKPAAVSKYGLPFMEFLNNLSIPVEAVANLMRGGYNLVEPTIKAFAQGGLVTDGPSFGHFGELSGILNSRVMSGAINTIDSSKVSTSSVNKTTNNNYVNIGKDTMPVRGNVPTRAQQLLDEVKRVY